MTTVFDPEVDAYLDRIGDAHSQANWDAVIANARATRRRKTTTRVVVGLGAPAAAALGVVAMSGMVGGPGVSLAQSAQAAVLSGPKPTQGFVIRDRVRDRDASGSVFTSYDTWVAPDGTWCRATVEGSPAGAPSSGVTTSFTQCRLPDRTVELYIPGDDAIYRVNAGEGGQAFGESPATLVGATPSGLLVRVINPGRDDERLEVYRPDGTAKPVIDGEVRGAERLSDAEIDALSDGDHAAIKEIVAKIGGSRAAVDPGPAPNWISDELISALSQRGLHEDGTQEYEGRTYVRMVTDGVGDVLLVDPSTKDVAVWIPGREAFGGKTVVTHERDQVPADATSLRYLDLEELHPSARVETVSPRRYFDLLSSQYPNG